MEVDATGQAPSPGPATEDTTARSLVVPVPVARVHTLAARKLALPLDKQVASTEPGAAPPRKRRRKPVQMDAAAFSVDEMVDVPGSDTPSSTLVVDVGRASSPIAVAATSPTLASTAAAVVAEAIVDPEAATSGSAQETPAPPALSAGPDVQTHDKGEDVQASDEEEEEEAVDETAMGDSAAAAAATTVALAATKSTQPPSLAGSNAGAGPGSLKHPSRAYNWPPRAYSDPAPTTRLLQTRGWEMMPTGEDVGTAGFGTAAYDEQGGGGPSSASAGPSVCPPVPRSPVEPGVTVFLHKADGYTWRIAVPPGRNVTRYLPTLPSSTRKPRSSTGASTRPPRWIVYPDDLGQLTAHIPPAATGDAEPTNPSAGPSQQTEGPEASPAMAAAVVAAAAASVPGNRGTMPAMPDVPAFPAAPVRTAGQEAAAAAVSRRIEERRGSPTLPSAELAQPARETVQDAGDGLTITAAMDVDAMEHGGTAREVRDRTLAASAPPRQAAYSVQLAAWVRHRWRPQDKGDTALITLKWSQRIAQPDLCCVCLQGPGSGGHALLACSAEDCDVIVHRGTPCLASPHLTHRRSLWRMGGGRHRVACYGVTDASLRRKQWFCDRCQYKEPVVCLAATRHGRRGC
jgi:hypothetical protein